MCKPKKSAITEAAEKKQHLKQNLSQLVEQTQGASSSFNIALSALKSNNPDAAIKKFLQVLEIDNSEEMQKQVFPNLGQAYLQNGGYQQALIEFRKALRLNQPDDIKAFIYANLGYIFTHYQFYGFAIREYRAAIKENKHDLTSYLSLGMLYENTFRYPEAVEVFERMLKLDPENQYAKESLARIEAATPVVPKEEVVRLVSMIPTLGIIIAMSYDATFDGYFPMVIYIYDRSPLKGKIEPGEKILNVMMSNSQEIEEDDERELLELLNSPPQSEVRLLVGENELQVTCIKPIQHQMDHAERLNVYKNWLQSFDSRIAWLWSASEEIREHIGPLWGNELESLVRELGPLKNTFVYDFAYALMIEHLQAFAITETQPGSKESKEIEIQYQINLGRFFGKQRFEDLIVFADLIRQFNEVQFNYMANLLASRV